MIATGSISFGMSIVATVLLWSLIMIAFGYGLNELLKIIEGEDEEDDSN